MSNSSLVSYTKRSPNCISPRKYKIDTITPHCVVGQCSVETLGNIFAPSSAKKSSNYGIGADGRIGLYVDEKNCSFCSSNLENDHRAITIECASDAFHPYAINDKVYRSLVNLCVDICKRNGIPELKWRGDKSLVGQIDKQNITVHRWFANKACPGDYIYNRLGQLAVEVNSKLKQSSDSTAILYKVQTGAFHDKKNAEKVLKDLRSKHFSAYITKVNKLYKVQLGAFSKKRNADNLAKKVRDKTGYNTYIVTTRNKCPNKKTDLEIAKEVIKGSWGNGEDRVNRLLTAGYNPADIQKIVNSLL